jgi:hypothetical protein
MTACSPFNKTDRLSSSLSPQRLQFPQCLVTKPLAEAELVPPLLLDIDEFKLKNTAVMETMTGI